MQAGAPETEFFPVRMSCEQRMEKLVEHLAALIQRPEIDLAAGRDDLERRRRSTRHPSANIAPDIRSRKKDKCRDSGPACAAAASALYDMELPTPSESR